MVVIWERRNIWSKNSKRSRQIRDDPASFWIWKV